MTAPPIDLNADLGEGFGHWRLTDDEGLLSVVSSANVACGFHAGDAPTMRRVCDLAAARGVRIGAQVSYRDLAGFGRRAMDVPADELAAEVAYQIGALQTFARAAGAHVAYVKPHGALYNRVVHDAEQAAAVVDGVLLAGGGPLRAQGSLKAPGALGHPGAAAHTAASVAGAAASAGAPGTHAPGAPADASAHPDDEPAARQRAGRTRPDVPGARTADASRRAARASGMPVLGLPGSRLLAAAAAAGLPAVAEAFADRGYTREGTLVPRGLDGAVLTSPEAVVERSVSLARHGRVISRCGHTIEVRARSLCVHGDTPGAVGLARRLRAGLEDAGVRVVAFA